MGVREEMWAQAARDRDALEAELGLRHEEERSRFLEEANERASEIVEEVGVAWRGVAWCAQSPRGRAKRLSAFLSDSVATGFTAVSALENALNELAT